MTGKNKIEEPKIEYVVNPAYMEALYLRLYNQFRQDKMQPVTKQPVKKTNKTTELSWKTVFHG